MKWTRIILVAVAMLTGLPAAFADGYPNRSIKVIIPYPAGGGADIVGRRVLDKVSSILGVPIVVENRGGSATILGTNLVAKAEPDGYTLLYTASALSVNATYAKKLPYDTKRDLIPIGMAAYHPFVLVTNAKLPVTSFREFINYVKARPNQINYASVGVGSTQHLEMELLKKLTGIEVTHIPYRGSSPAMQDLLAGQVMAMFNGLSPTLAHIRAGTIRALAVDTPQRVGLLPDVPTLQELGLSGFDIPTWSGLFAPAGVKPEIVERLSKAMVEAVNSSSVRDALLAAGLVPTGKDAAEFARFINADIDRWAAVIRDLKLDQE